MQKKLWRIMIISIVTGIILSIISYIYIFSTVKVTSEFTFEMETMITTLEAISSLILFVITGIFCFKDMTRKETAKSAAVVSIYYITVFALEQLFQTMGLNPLMMFVDLVLFVPLKIYSSAFGVLIQLSDLNAYLCIIPTFFLPFLYVLFSKRNHERQYGQD
ncbi:hypothetical protein [Cellulosilyticum sp. I15G10I2]|uniref:hypothetical protein n=1 Tax=Cellulosilyticum sp. I15G10I2 TaxID=1892843 RepID=UPI00085C409E|nr:hypothetical protein [Cellulosilyticum sp. I15G10I2]